MTNINLILSLKDESEHQPKWMKRENIWIYFPEELLAEQLLIFERNLMKSASFRRICGTAFEITAQLNVEDH